MYKIVRAISFSFVSLLCAHTWASDNQRITKLITEAEKGKAKAQTELGIMYAEGEQIEQDYVKAHSLLERAGNQGYADAEYNLGVMYGNGDGVLRDTLKSREWFEKAAVHGHAAARYNLGVMYSLGIGVKKDQARAEYWFNKAGEEGTSEDKYTMGVMYSEGKSIPKDLYKAKDWFLKAAMEGHVLAKYNLAVMYSEGMGGARDLNEAIVWSESAAGQGDRQASELLDQLKSIENKRQAAILEEFLLSGTLTNPFENIRPPRRLQPALPLLSARESARLEKETFQSEAPEGKLLQDRDLHAVDGVSILENQELQHNLSTESSLESSVIPLVSQLENPLSGSQDTNIPSKRIASTKCKDQAATIELLDLVDPASAVNACNSSNDRVYECLSNSDTKEDDEIAHKTEQGETSVENHQSDFLTTFETDSN